MIRPALRLIPGSSPKRAEGGRIERDRALADGVAKGDHQAISALTTRCLNLVTALATRTLNDRAEAEDVAQDTFLKVWRKIDQFDPERAKLESWVARIALNLCYDRLRKRGESLLDGEFPDRVDETASAEGSLSEADMARRVRAVVAQLPPRQRAALELCHFQECSNIEAAEILGVSVDAVESLLARARRKLKSELQAQHNEMLEGFAMGHGGEA